MQSPYFIKVINAIEDFHLDNVAIDRNAIF